MPSRLPYYHYCSFRDDHEILINACTAGKHSKHAKRGQPQPCDLQVEWRSWHPTRTDRDLGAWEKYVNLSCVRLSVMRLFPPLLVTFEIKAYLSLLIPRHPK